MGWWKADPPSPSTPTQQPNTPPSPPPTAAPAARPQPATSSSSESACPVDPKTRSLWLQHAQAQTQANTFKPTQPPTIPANHPPLPLPPSSTTPTLASKECSSDRITGQSATPPPTTTKAPRHLSQEREVSSIPRAQTLPSSTSLPANNETETGPHPSGNWIYPSESQFYHAVLSKNTLSSSSPTQLASSISSIIPIHNAVNERAWTLIKSWEGNSSDSCGGPKLARFAGKGAGAQTPRAKWNAWVKGTREPFDRHDWVVERCGGERVEYVIDFYEGKGSGSSGVGGGQGKDINFFLDVRPKLNSVEGCRMRFERYWGWR